MVSLRRPEGIFFGLVWSRKTSCKRAAGKFRMFLAGNMRAKPREEWVLPASGRKDEGDVWRASGGIQGDCVRPSEVWLPAFRPTTQSAWLRPAVLRRPRPFASCLPTASRCLCSGLDTSTCWLTLSCVPSLDDYHSIRGTGQVSSQLQRPSQTETSSEVCRSPSLSSALLGSRSWW